MKRVPRQNPSIPLQWGSPSLTRVLVLGGLTQKQLHVLLLREHKEQHSLLRTASVQGLRKQTRKVSLKLRKPQALAPVRQEKSKLIIVGQILDAYNKI
jgi:hypothetical protein